MKYVLYLQESNILFTREELVTQNQNVLAPFENKTPVWTVEASDDSSAIAMFNAFMSTQPSK